MAVRLLTGAAVRVLDHLDQPVDMRLVAEDVTMDVLIFVAMRHVPMLRAGQVSAGEQ